MENLGRLALGLPVTVVTANPTGVTWFRLSALNPIGGPKYVIGVLSGSDPSTRDCMSEFAVVEAIVILELCWEASRCVAAERLEGRDGGCSSKVVSCGREYE